jgi:hypothetical protein
MGVELQQLVDTPAGPRISGATRKRMDDCHNRFDVTTFLYHNSNTVRANMAIAWLMRKVSMISAIDG